MAGDRDSTRNLQYPGQKAANADNTRLLFLGGTGSWFHEVEDAVLELRPVWSVQHVTDPGQVPGLLSSAHCDTLILHKDIVDGRKLIASMAEQFPHLHAFSLSEDVNRATPAPVAPPAADNVPAANSCVETAENVVRTVSLHQWTSQPSIRSLLGQIKKLPTLPRLHTQVTHELQSPNGSLEMVSQFVRQDPIMAAKFLQVINSAFFGLAYTISDPGEAVMFLGSVRTRELILMAGVFSQFDEIRCPGFSAEQIWQHSLQVARLAQGVALVQTEDPKLAEMAFTAGLLHDIGKLVLAGNVPEKYATAHKLQQFKKIQQSEAELTILNTTHAELGACLLGSWRLPLRIVEAVAWHHCPSKSYDPGFSVLTAVHAGNALAHEIAGANKGIGLPSRFDIYYLAKLGMAGRTNVWRQACEVPIRDRETTFEDTVRQRSEAKDN